MKQSSVNERLLNKMEQLYKHRGGWGAPLSCSGSSGSGGQIKKLVLETFASHILLCYRWESSFMQAVSKLTR